MGVQGALGLFQGSVLEAHELGLHEEARLLEGASCLSGFRCSSSIAKGLPLNCLRMSFYAASVKGS
jgi:hypothetical protein